VDGSRSVASIVLWVRLCIHRVLQSVLVSSNMV